VKNPVCVTYAHDDCGGMDFRQSGKPGVADIFLCRSRCIFQKSRQNSTQSVQMNLHQTVFMDDTGHLGDTNVALLGSFTSPRVLWSKVCFVIRSRWYVPPAERYVDHPAMLLTGMAAGASRDDPYWRNP